ncbi:hypothetical protein SLS61_006527 [Didymella pomorum]
MILRRLQTLLTCLQPQMETLQICIEHLLRAEQQSHDERERIYHLVSSGRKLLAEGFAELLNNDRHGTAQRIGFLVGYASAFRMHSMFITQARNAYGGQELANYYRHPNHSAFLSGFHPGPVTCPEYPGRNPNTYSYVPSFPERPSPGYPDIGDREGRPVTTVYPDQELVDRSAAARNGHAATNGGVRVDRHAVTAVPQTVGRQLNGDSAVGLAANSFINSTISLNHTNGVGSPHDTVMSNGNGIANDDGTSRDPVDLTTPPANGTIGPHMDSALNEAHI